MCFGAAERGGLLFPSPALSSRLPAPPWAQSTTAKPAATPAPSSATGFAIESEMLTYTAMDSQAQAVACGIARNVGAADEKCSPRAPSGPGTGIVVVASPSSAMSEFQLWRADISSMKMLTQRASHYCPQSSRDRGATTSSSTSLGSTILSMIPGGQALSFAQALFSSSSESNPVEGNIGDQALVADVAGHLRAIGLSVVIPDTYMPHSLAAVDNAHSPYMSNIAALLKARDCLTATPAQKLPDQAASPDTEHGTPADEKDQQSESDKQAEADKQTIGHAIDAFLTSLADAHVSPRHPRRRRARLLLHLHRSFLTSAQYCERMGSRRNLALPLAKANPAKTAPGICFGSRRWNLEEPSQKPEMPSSAAKPISAAALSEPIRSSGSAEMSCVPESSTTTPAPCK